MYSMRSIWLLIAVALVASPARAWNPAGHMAIASIADDELTPGQRESLVNLLRQHPRFAQDFQAAMPPDLDPEKQARWIFMRASVWPDLARNIQGTDQQIYNHPTWHYIDLPIFLDEQAQAKIHLPPFEFDYHKATNPQSMNVVQALNKSMDELKDQSLAPAARAVALCWVLHLASDIHQPLHGAALFSAERFRGIPIGDKGGNDIPVQEQAGLLSTYTHPNLHALWDCILGVDDSYDAVQQLAAQLVAAHSKQSLAPLVNHLDARAWSRESNEAAAKTVYGPQIRKTVEAAEEHPHAPLPTIEIGDDYLNAARPVAQRRAALAAYRTASLLKSL